MKFRSAATLCLSIIIGLGFTACSKPESGEAAAKKNNKTANKTKTTGKTDAKPETNKKTQVSNTADDASRRDVKKAVLHGLALLDKNDMQSFIKTYMPPQVLEPILKKTNIKEFAASMAKSRGQVFKNILSEAKSLEPKYNDAKTEAKFELKKSKTPLRYIKIGDYWYIK